MKIYLKDNVYEAALKRIRYIFDEFDTVIVNISGGKDSTVVLELAIMVAKERGRLPQLVMFIDQEAEWDATIQQVRSIMSRREVNPIWLQVPFKIFNATSNIEPWLNCWEEGKEWIREKEKISIKENVYGTDRFAELFEGYTKYHYPNQKVARIAGVRCEESPGRMMGLTTGATYKHITWGRVEDKKIGHFTFYPIYDWSYTDVWKAIHDNNWAYCKLYDYMYQYGIKTRDMRVSNIHHETAVKTLFYLQEIESETWNKVTKRISGLNMAKHLKDGMLMPKELPFMFNSWREYRDHLLENLIEDEKIKATFRDQFESFEKRFHKVMHDQLCKVQISCILVNDYFLTKLSNFQASNARYLVGGSKLKGKNV